LAILILAVLALLGSLATMRPPQVFEQGRSNTRTATASSSGNDEPAPAGKAASAPDAPDFAFPPNIPGLPSRLSKLRGKVVVLDFWAPWCGPCKLAMPELDRVYRKLKSRGLVVIGIDADDPPNWTQMEATQRSLNISYLMLAISEVPGADSAYEHSGLPAMYIIDRAGKVQYSIGGFDKSFDMESFVEALLQK
jgi:thiol-disulfide isomerase/thioredoxin